MRKYLKCSVFIRKKKLEPTVQKASTFREALAFAHLTSISTKFHRISSNCFQQFWQIQLDPAFYRHRSVIKNDTIKSLLL